jgi:hypothetical protein
MITAMTQIFAGILVVAAMLAPYVVVAALTVAFPQLRRGIGQIPRTDEVVGRFFDRTILRPSRPNHGSADVRMWTEDDPSWNSSGSVGERR